MTELYTWLARRARRQRARASLPAALLLGRGFAYAFTRLGPVWLGLALRTGLHAAEFYLLSLAVPYEYLAPLFGYRTLVSLAATAHWGALEPLRQSVRRHVQAQQLRAARELIARALGVSLLLASAPLLACSVYIASELWRGRGLSLYDAYAWACALRIALEAYARTYHAGVYAARRVYRPLWSFAAADALSLGLIVLGFDALGAFVVPLAVAASALLDVVLCMRAARAAYRLARMSSPWPAVHLQLSAAGAALLPALANVSLQLDALVLLALVALEPARAPRTSFVALYYVLRPLLGVASQWARVFYFDLSRLESGSLAALRGHLRRYLRRVGLICASLVAALTLMMVHAFWPSWHASEAASLIALVFARAWFAPVQLEAFVQRRYGLLLHTTLAFGALLLAAVAWNVSQAQLVLLAALALGIAARVLPGPLTSLEQRAGVCGVPELLARMRGQQPAQLAVLRMARGLPARRVLEALAQQDLAWSVAQFDRSRLLLLAAGERALDLPQLVAASAGLLESARWTSRAPASELLIRARRDALLPAELIAALDADVSAELVRAEFARAFPTGRVLDLHSGTGRLQVLGLSASQLAELSAQLVHACARPDQPARRSRSLVQLAAFAPAGRARWLFVVPRGTVDFAVFRARVRAATWRQSVFDTDVSRAQQQRDARADGSLARMLRSLHRRLGTHDV